MRTQLFQYVGPKHIAKRILPELVGVPIRAPDDVRAWAQATDQKLSASGVIATFVVDAFGVLRIADRHSEHVVCAGGHPVRSAGEVTFAIGGVVEVIAISNQSTGYCPTPESWSAVAEALAQAGLIAPDRFSLACVFRRCTGCGNLNLVKDGIFECVNCGEELPTTYNVQF